MYSFTERQLVNIVLDFLIESRQPFTSNDLRRMLRDTFGVREINNPNHISTAFRVASMDGRIKRTGRIAHASQAQANERAVTEWVTSEAPIPYY